MPEKLPTHYIVDIDGVLRREKLMLPGVPELFAAINRHAMYCVASNNSRINSAMVQSYLREYGVERVQPENGLTSADATAKWLIDNPSTNDPKLYVIADEGAGLLESLNQVGLSARNDELWDGKNWKEFPTDVVVGFDTGVDYKKLAPACDAIGQRGARFIGTNPDLTYRDAEGNIFPANGAALNYLASSGVQPTVIGKPNRYMGEIALQQLQAEQQSAVVAVIGDTFAQDMQMGLALREAGWEVRNWLVLSGVETAGSVRASSIKPDGIFQDIQEITKRIS